MGGGNVALLASAGPLRRLALLALAGPLGY